MVERENPIVVEVLDAIEERRGCQSRYADAVSENVPWMKRSDRFGDTGLPGSSVLAASVSFVTFSHPSFSFRFFHSAFSRASASLGSTKLTALSMATFPTLITIALIA